MTMNTETIEMKNWITRHRHIPGDGPPLLLLHTLRTQLEFCLPLVERLGGAFDVHLVDLPGHGFATRKPGQEYTAAFMLDSVVELVESLDLEEAWIAGESIGGTLALGVAARMPSRWRRVVASNPYDSGRFIGGWKGAILSVIGARTPLVTGPEPPAVLKSVLSAGFARPDQLTDAFIETLVASAHRPHFQPFMHSMLAHQRTWFELRSLYAQIPRSLPVDLVYGEQDWSALSVRAENARAIASVEAHLELPETGHFSFMDRPEAVAQLLVAAASDDG